MLLASPISHNSIQSLITKCILILSYFLNLVGTSFSFVLYFLRVSSLEINFCQILKFCPVFPGVMLSIRWSLLFL